MSVQALRRIREYAHESNLIEGFDDPKADEAIIEAWRLLGNLANDYKQAIKSDKAMVNNRIICRVHEVVVSHQDNQLSIWPGVYRDRSRVNVTIGGRPGLAPALIPAAMEKWLAELWDNSPRENHIAFEKIHPFIDGNGRVGRLLMWWQEQQLEQTPTLVRDAEKQAYYEWFHDEED